MLQLLSNLNLVTRIELQSTLAEMDKTLQGNWVKADGTVATASEISPGAAFQIWSESDRSKEKAFEADVNRGSYATSAMSGLGSGHYSPDAADTLKVTVLYGKYRALTNMWVGTAPAIGETLFVQANGFLSVDATPSGAFTPFAVCTKAPASVTHIGESYSCIEYVTV